MAINTSIFYFNDVHGNYDSLASLKRASSEFSRTRNNPQVDPFKLAGGDLIKGKNSDINNMWVEFLNSIELDASALGNHELDQGNQNLAQYLQKANFEFVSSNIEVNPNGPLAQGTKDAKLVKSMVMRKNGNLYGFIGLSPSDKKYKNPGAIFSTPDINAKNTNASIAELQKEVDRLKQAGINKIILLSHFDDEQNLIPRSVSGIDIIISGHKHRVHPGLMPGKNFFYSPVMEPMIKVEGGRDGKYFGTLDVSFDDYGRITGANNNLFETKSIPPDYSVIPLKQKYGLYNNPVGYLRNSVSNATLPENPLGSLIADAARAKAGADLGLVHIGNISGGLEKGFITQSDINQVLPYKSKVTKIVMPKQEIVKAIRAFPGLQVSGLKYAITPDNKVVNIQFDKEQDVYTIAVGDFLLKKAKGIKYKVLEHYDWDKAQATIEYIKNKHFVPFDIKPEGRITVANPQ